MLEALLKEAREKMDKAVQVVDHDLSALRTGRATIHLLDGISVAMYGQEQPINQLATVSTPDAQTIAIQPWDRSALGPIEKAILQANIGLTPNNDGKIIRLNVPPLTEETRRDVVKRAHAIAEEGRIAIRNIRRHVNDTLKKSEKEAGVSEDEKKRLLDQVQKLTDEHIKQVDEHMAAKEAEIMKV
ncbi:MAG TPA: ribosome recycling factor [Candidatus Sumerlaeota bacterium]|nr:MAG: Ribosome-recycling factor [candidate division BRC1 bacterium ADurb.BinA292]HOR29024.1 ribosome recycling factor [Candidatus Sumerlaeota bacterium]HPK03702.1 ribosome recycling factor [Candidatus Sumerlaeota bacterium]